MQKINFLPQLIFEIELTHVALAETQKIIVLSYLNKNRTHE